MEKFWEQEYILDYEDLGDLHVFTIEDNDGIFHEVRIWVQRGQELTK